jgi:tetratricopeptide (TPR) repeat protein
VSHHFISYARDDASAFAKNLRLDLEADHLPTWMDSYLKAGSEWRKVIDKAIAECTYFLFIISRESVKKTSFCQQELEEAQKKKKPVIPIKFHSIAPLPESLERLHYIDFSDPVNKRAALAQLLKLLSPGPEPGPDPVQKPITINSSPLLIPSHFRGRQGEITSVTEFLSEDAKPLLLIVGREGSGKTALICQVLDMIKRGARNGPKITPRVDAIIYLNSTGHDRVSWSRFFSDVSRLLSSRKKRDAERLFTQPGMTMTLKMQWLLSALADQRILVLLDHLDDVIDASTSEILDSELAEGLRAVLEQKSHNVKLIITSQVAPKDLLFTLPAGPDFVDLGHGLPLREAKEALYALDGNGQLGLAAASQQALDEICHRTQGNPRALEILCALFRTDRDISLKEVLEKTNGLLPHKVLEALIGQAFHRLDPASQKIMQALAIYARPVTVKAVKYLLEPHLPNVDSQSFLSRLANMQLVRKEDDRYYLHETDREYVLSTIPEGQDAGHSSTEPPPFTRLALLHRGADYFRQSGSSTEDLAPKLAEFDLRYRAQEYDSAARIMTEVEDSLLGRGHYRQVSELREQLRGKLDDPQLNRRQFDTLARVYHRLGALEQAIHCYEEGLRYVRRMQDSLGECLYLSNLAICLMESGQWDLAITYCRLTLNIAGTLQDRPRQAHVLNTLSDCLAYVGKTPEAVNCCEQSLTLARACMKREQEVVILANMGQHYGELGETDKALSKCDKSLAIAKTIKFQLGEATALRNLAELDADKNKLKQALELYERAIELADLAQSAQLQQTTRTGLALALLLFGELADARVSSEAACQYDVPAFNCEAFAVLGVIVHRLEDGRAARDAFNKAVQHANAMLAKTPQAYKALDARGLALSGLALLEGSTDDLEDAIEAYHAARRFTSDAGIVHRVLRCFDELAKADLAHRLAPVRQAAAGSEPMSPRS